MTEMENPFNALMEIQITDGMIERAILAGINNQRARVGVEPLKSISDIESDPPVMCDRETMRAALEAALRSVPRSGVSMRDVWKPNERVVHVSRPFGPYSAEQLRPGVVVSVDEVLRRHERLKVRFDDGEERYINPDVMRHER